jgi:hypothetical protein
MTAIERLSGDLANIDRMLDECYDAFYDNAERFTCREMETLAEAYRRRGREGQAESLLGAHADGDEEGDWHESTYNEAGNWTGWKYQEGRA